ncbi:MAG: DEAD/DEAH box helicase [Thiolinea sp.]
MLAVSMDSMLHLKSNGQGNAIIRQACRDNTYETPKREKPSEKACKYLYRRDSAGVHFPRGYAGEFFRQFPTLYSQMEDSRSIAPAAIPALQGIILRDYQQRAVDVIGKLDQGIIEAPTGAGKTIIGLSLMHKAQQRVLVLVHNKALLQQWQQVIRKLLGIEAGVIGDGQWREGEQITIAVIQTLVKRFDQLPSLGRGYGLLMVDECHHIPANTFSAVVNELPCKYRFGLTATPWRNDGLHEIIARYIGRNLVKISAGEVEQAGGIVGAQVVRVHVGGCDSDWVDDYENHGDYRYHEFVTDLVLCEQRNEMIMQLATEQAWHTPTLILTDRIQHAEALCQMNPEAVLVHGGLGKKTREQAMQAMAQAELSIGTFGTLGEGVDVARWGCLVLAMPTGSRARVLQALGRVLRASEGKQSALVYDICDMHPFAEKNMGKRLAIYRERGYPVRELGDYVEGSQVDEDLL